MGNRAVIETKSRDIGIYLHWNGGRDSVEAFLTYCKVKGFPSPERDSYGWARLTQVIANFFGGGLCVGIDGVKKLDEDNFDNGVYIIENWEIIGRLYTHGGEQQRYGLLDIMKDINNRQPEDERLPEVFLDESVNDNISPIDLIPGDYALFMDNGSYTGGKVTDYSYENDYGVVIAYIDGEKVAGQNIVRTAKGNHDSESSDGLKSKDGAEVITT